MSAFLFEEEQRFKLWWMWLLMLTGLLLPLVMVAYAFIVGAQAAFTKKDTILLLGIFLIYNLPILVLFFYARLRTKISNEGIYYGWNIPTSELNFIAWNDMTSCEMVQHTFVGYGYKLTKKYGTVYNTAGKHGLWITKHSGERVLIGTLKIDDIKASLIALKKNQKQL
jgi:hypothetical protein